MALGVSDFGVKTYNAFTKAGNWIAKKSGHKEKTKPMLMTSGEKQ